LHAAPTEIWNKLQIPISVPLRLWDKVNQCKPVASGPELQILADICVSALCLDTPEMYSTMNITARYYVRGEGADDRAACILCHIPATAFHLNLQELSSVQRTPRSIDKVKEAGAALEADPDAMNRAGE
jgi:hypothetical protein